MKKIFKHIPTLITSIILFAGVPVLYAWTGPTSIPPTGNVSAPINIGTTSQNKLGALGLGGLVVFGKSLLTETSDYELSSAKPTMLLGVNGAIGAKEYCDEKGQNCVNTLGGISSNGESSSGGITTSNSQIVVGWPNKILCEGGTQKSVLYMNGISGVGYPEIRVTYTSFADAGSHTQLQFNYSNGQYLSRTATTDGYVAAIDACVAKGNIKNQAGFN